MSDAAKKQAKPQKLRARQPRGFIDRSPADIRATEAMIAKIKAVYEKYGFDPVETPLVEYTDALGKFLPDSDRPNEGVFSFKDDDEQWLSLRYDLTAPLARHVAENINEISLPYRTYRAGWVFRNEKPGPGRFRQFMQFDADTVGAPGLQADAEMCMMMADTLEALGIPRGQYVIRVNNRKVLDGVMEAIGVTDAGQKLAVLRAIDKLDKFGIEGVRQLLGAGRKDESGDFTKGAGLNLSQAESVLSLFSNQTFPVSASNYLSETDLVELEKLVSELIYVKNIESSFNKKVPSEIKKHYIEENFLENVEKYVFGQSRFPLDNQKLLLLARHPIFNKNQKFNEGIEELIGIARIIYGCGYQKRVIRIETAAPIIRGLEYYTGTVFEAELLFDVTNEKGEKVVFGSVGGGGRYDGLVKRFTGQDVPATGFSIGLSRLMTALKNLGRLEGGDMAGPVVVCVMDKDVEALGEYMKMVQELRRAGIRAEMFQGNPKQFGKQLQYADRRGAPVCIIQGSDERARGVVQVKDMIEGRRQAAAIESNEDYRAARVGQFEIARADLVAEVRRVLNEQAAG
jgi:histidyl-tRNA synthetase